MVKDYRDSLKDLINDAVFLQEHPSSEEVHRTGIHLLEDTLDNLKRIIDARECDIKCLEDERKYLLYRIAQLEEENMILRSKP